MLIGGGKNHRMGLFDMVMIKDNHISAAGGIVDAIKSVDEYLNQNNLEMDVEVSVRAFKNPLRARNKFSLMTKSISCSSWRRGRLRK